MILAVRRRTYGGKTIFRINSNISNADVLFDNIAVGKVNTDIVINNAKASYQVKLSGGTLPANSASYSYNLLQMAGSNFWNNGINAWPNAYIGKSGTSNDTLFHIQQLATTHSYSFNYNNTYQINKTNPILTVNATDTASSANNWITDNLQYTSYVSGVYVYDGQDGYIYMSPNVPANPTGDNRELIRFTVTSPYGGGSAIIYVYQTSVSDW